MHPLHFNPSTAQWSIGPTEAERKGAIIADISTIQVSLGKGPVGLAQFEMLMQLPLGKLQEFVLDQSSLLERIKVDFPPPPF